MINAAALQSVFPTGQFSESSRVQWIDVARGIGIILVVYGHVLKGLEAAGLIGPRGALRASDHAIYTFHMPLFFFLAGLTVERSYRKSRVGFLRNKFATIAYPYLLWSIVQGAIQVAVPGFVNSPRSSYVLSNLLWRPNAQFWFLYALLACHLVAWVCRVRRGPLATLAILALLSFSLLPPSILHNIVQMFPFYASGFFLSKVAAMLTDKTTDFAICLASAVTYALCLYVGAISPLGSPVANFFAAIFGIAATIFLSRSIQAFEFTITAPLAYLGRASMTIYLLHIIAAVSVRVILLRLGLTLPVEHIMLGVTAGIAIPLVFSAVVDRFSAAKFLGLPTLARRPAATSIFAAKPV